MKKLKFLILTSLFISSCGPANSGKIEWRQDEYCKRRAVLRNTSSHKKITFVIYWRWVKDGKAGDLKQEETVSPQEEKILGCMDTDPTFDVVIVSAYETNNRN